MSDVEHLVAALKACELDELLGKAKRGEVGRPAENDDDGDDDATAVPDDGRACLRGVHGCVRQVVVAGETRTLFIRFVWVD